MTGRMRENLGAVLIGVLLAVLGVVVYGSSDAAAAVLFALALITGGVGLLNIALDLLGVLPPKKDQE